MEIFVAEMSASDSGNEPTTEIVGVFSDLETAWEAAITAAPNTAEVRRYTLDQTNGGETVRWREWSGRSRTVVTLTPGTVSLR